MNPSRTRLSTAAVARKWARQFALIFAVWTVSGILAATQWCIPAWGGPDSPSWRQLLIPSLIGRWIFALLTPGVLWLSSRFPFVRGSWLRSLGFHVLGAAAFLVLWVSIRLPLYPITDQVMQKQMEPSWRVYHDMIVEDALYATLMYATIVAVSQLWEHYRKYREGEVLASRLQAELAKAELKVLKMQLDPQFLFHALESISTLIHRDVEAADDLVASLSEFLRISLEDAEEQEVTLKREIDYLHAYLEVQRIRLGGRLNVALEIDPRALDALVPNMTLPVLIENILPPGFEDSDAPASIEVRSEVRWSDLHLEIERVPSPTPNLNLRDTEDDGMAAFQSRLHRLYSDLHRFEVLPTAKGGALLKLEFPFMTTQSSAQALIVAQPLLEVT